MFHGSGQRFLVIHLRLSLVDFHAELAFQTVHDDIEVKLAHTAYDGLAVLLVGLHREGRVLLGQLAECDAEFVEVFLRLGLYRQTDYRFGEGHGFENYRSLLIAERIARAYILETDYGTDVTGTHRFKRILLVGVHLVDTADTLLLARPGVEHVASRIELARIDAHESEAAHIGVGGYLEREGAERFRFRRMAYHLFAGSGIHTLDGFDIERRGQERHDGVEQQLHTLVLKRGAAEHRYDGHLDGRLADGRFQLFGGYRIRVLEELLHQGLVHGSDLFDEFRTVFLHLGLHVGRNLLVGIVNEFVLLGIVVYERPIIYKVYHAGELVLGSDRQGDGHRIGSEALLHLCAYGQEVGTGTVHLVDVTDTGHIVFVGLAPYGFGLGFHAADCTEGSHGTVEHTERTLHLHGKVHVSGSVDEVDLIGLVLITPESGGGGGGNGNTPLLFLHHPVHRGGPFVHLADFVRLAGVEKDTFGRRGFTGIDVGHDAYVACKFKVFCHMIAAS